MTRIIAALMILSSVALAGGATSSLFFQQPLEPQSFILSFGSEAYVSIHPDGTIHFGPNYKPVEAAKAFWDAIGQRMPKRGFVGCRDGLLHVENIDFDGVEMPAEWTTTNPCAPQ